MAIKILVLVFLIWAYSACTIKNYYVPYRDDLPDEEYVKTKTEIMGFKSGIVEKYSIKLTFQINFDESDKPKRKSKTHNE